MPNSHIHVVIWLPIICDSLSVVFQLLVEMKEENSKPKVHLDSTNAEKSARPSVVSDIV